MLKLTKFPPPFGGGSTFYYTSHVMSQRGSFCTFIVHGPWTGSKTVRILLKIEKNTFCWHPEMEIPSFSLRTGLGPVRKSYRYPLDTIKIYSRFWYAFSLFLRKFHSVNPFNGNLFELGRARFAEKKMELPSQVVRKTYSLLFSAKFGPFSNPFRGRASAVHDKRVEWTCARNILCSKTWNTPRTEVETLLVQHRKSISIWGINLIVWRGVKWLYRMEFP